MLSVSLVTSCYSYYPVYQGTAHTHKINRLQEMTEYSFRVNARNQAGEGPYSQEFGFKTTKAPPPAVKGNILYNYYTLKEYLLLFNFVCRDLWDRDC